MDLIASSTESRAVPYIKVAHANYSGATQFPYEDLICSLGNVFQISLLVSHTYKGD
jgi:hypothetical protein